MTNSPSISSMFDDLMSKMNKNGNIPQDIQKLLKTMFAAGAVAALSLNKIQKINSKDIADEAMAIAEPCDTAFSPGDDDYGHRWN